MDDASVGVRSHNPNKQSTHQSTSQKLNGM
jgi:hypothetical protein